MTTTPVHSGAEERTVDSIDRKIERCRREIAAKQAPALTVDAFAAGEWLPDGTSVPRPSSRLDGNGWDASERGPSGKPSAYEGYGSAFLVNGIWFVLVAQTQQDAAHVLEELDFSGTVHLDKFNACKVVKP